MMRAPGVGILGIGTFLPPDVRRNDWWPEATVAAWRERRTVARRGLLQIEPTSEGMARVIAALREVEDDPFRGVETRHVMPDEMTSQDMEERAAHLALERSGVAPDAIDLLLVHSVVPDFLATTSACTLHRRLELARACFVMQADASAYSFMHQLVIADAMIAGGRARYALIVQSSAASRLLVPSDPISPTLGDGATAVVVGPVGDGRGVIAHAQFADGAFANTLVAGVPGGRWHDAARTVLYIENGTAERQVFLESLDFAREAVAAVLARSSMEPADIDFFAAHQGTPWLRRLAQDYVGLGGARSIDTYSGTGYLFGASIPLGLERAERDGLLGAGDRVLLWGGGTGLVFGAITLRWGR